MKINWTTNYRSPATVKITRKLETLQHVFNELKISFNLFIGPRYSLKNGKLTISGTSLDDDGDYLCGQEKSSKIKLSVIGKYQNTGKSFINLGIHEKIKRKARWRKTNGILEPNRKKSQFSRTSRLDFNVQDKKNGVFTPENYV